MVMAAICGCGPGPDDTAVSLVTEISKRPWNSDYSSGFELTTAHYRIYTTATSRALKSYLPGFMEASYQNYLRLSDLPDLPVSEPMPIYMLATRTEWVALTKSIIGGKALSLEAG